MLCEYCYQSTAEYECTICSIQICEECSIVCETCGEIVCGDCVDTTGDCKVCEGEQKKKEAR